MGDIQEKSLTAKFAKAAQEALRKHGALRTGSVVSRVLLKRENGNVTIFAFDDGQGLSEHTSPFDALVQAVEGRD